MLLEMNLKLLLSIVCYFMLFNLQLFSQEVSDISTLKIFLDSVKNNVVEIEERNLVYEDLISKYSDSLQIEILLVKAKDNLSNFNYREVINGMNLIIDKTDLEFQIENKLYYYLGYSYLASNEFLKSVDSYNFLIENDENIKMKANGYFYVSEGYKKLGEYDLALSALKKVKYDQALTEALILSRITNIYLSKGDLESAENIIDKRFQLDLDDFSLLQLYYEKASLEILKENYTEGVNYLLKARTKSVNQSTDWNINNNLSYSYQKLNSKKALELADTVLLTKRKYYKKQYNFQYSIPYQNKANYYSNQGEHDLALKLIDSAIYNHCYGISIEGNPHKYKINPILLSDKQSLVDYLEVKIEIATNAQDTVQLERSFLFIDSLIQAIREERFDDKSRFFHQQKLSKYYKQAFHFFLAKNDFKKAYAFTQKMKNIILLESLHYKSAHQALPENYKERYDGLTDSINNLSLSINSESVNDSLSFEIDKLKLSLLNFTNQLKRKYPIYHRMRYSGTNTSIEDIQKLCRKEQVMLDYYFGDTTLHIFLISENSFQYFQKPIDSTFIESLEKQINNIAKRPSILEFEKGLSSLKSDLSDLYKILIPQDAERFESMIIIPYDRLFYFPFETLITDLNSSCPYLVCNKSISYSFSSNLWRISKMNKESQPNKTMIYSPHQSNQKSELFLPFAKHESTLIETMTDADLFTDLDTKSFFTKSKSYNIHHLLSHAFIDNEKSDRSYLSLGERNDSISIQDIVNSNLKSKMVCLSACDSGIGNLKKEEGVISLARGFLQSGAESIVMSSFKVSDRTGSEIITEFYKNLRSGKNKARSLSHSKKTYLNRSSHYLSHPYFWSAFTIQGNEDALYERTKGPSKILVGILSLVLLIVAVRLYRNRQLITNF